MLITFEHFIAFKTNVVFQIRCLKHFQCENAFYRLKIPLRVNEIPYFSSSINNFFALKLFFSANNLGSHFWLQAFSSGRSSVSQKMHHKGPKTNHFLLIGISGSSLTETKILVDNNSVGSWKGSFDVSMRWNFLHKIFSFGIRRPVPATKFT